MACTSTFFTETLPDLFLLHRHFHRLSSAEGRGIPDISAQADNYYVIYRRTKFSMSGTSQAVPVRFLSLCSNCGTQLITRRIDGGGNNITAKRLLALQG